MLSREQINQEKLQAHLQEKQLYRQRRAAEKKAKEDIEHLSKISWMNVVDRGDWKQRCYRGKRSKYIKKQANKKTRRYQGGIASGSNYKKTSEYWYELI